MRIGLSAIRTTHEKEPRNHVQCHPHGPEMEDNAGICSVGENTVDGTNRGKHCGRLFAQAASEELFQVRGGGD